MEKEGWTMAGPPRPLSSGSALRSSGRDDLSTSSAEGFRRPPEPVDHEPDDQRNHSGSQVPQGGTGKENEADREGGYWNHWPPGQSDRVGAAGKLSPQDRNRRGGPDVSGHASDDRKHRQRYERAAQRQNQGQCRLGDNRCG